MLLLPAHFAGLIRAFALMFVHRSWRHGQVLLIGAILTPGRRRHGHARLLRRRSRGISGRGASRSAP